MSSSVDHITTLRPLRLWPSEQRLRVCGVFADIDDTLTDDGRIRSSVFEAMERLQAAGKLMIPITGRSAGWCDMIARTWPVDAVVGENGALYFRYDSELRRMHRAFVDPPETRSLNRRRLEAVRDEVLKTVAGAAVAADQLYRETDLAIDFAEDVALLPAASIDAIVAAFERHGATAKISSIHVNGWFGDYDKLTMTKRMMQELFDVDLDAAMETYAFIGDSPNDAPMFGYFPNAVGVANLMQFQDQCPMLPEWITEAPRGDGFVELVDMILSGV